MTAAIRTGAAFKNRRGAQTTTTTTSDSKDKEKEKEAA
jgi:hypothetical protein